MRIVFSSPTITITRSTKRAPKCNGARFDLMAQYALGTNAKGKNRYDLAVHFVGKDKIRALNTIYRKKTYVTDILSFPYDKNIGEIFIHLDKVAQKAKIFRQETGDKKITSEIYLEQLFIHGLLHLKGYDHGSTMEKKEAQLQHKFKLPRIPWH